METRKIQQVGGGTYTVSLPKSWAESADIEPGSVVALHSHIDGTLVVQTRPGGDEATAPLTLSVADADPACIERAVRAAYAAGIGTIQLENLEADSHHRLLQRVARTLTGLTITESTDRAVRLRSLLDAAEVSIPQSVRQLQFAALSAHRDATAALLGSERIENPADRDDQADRLFAMVDRYFQRGLDSLSVMDDLGSTRSELFVYWITARELEAIADHAQRIATVANRLEGSIESEFAAEFEDLATTAQELVRDAVAVVLDDDGMAAARGVLDGRDRLRGDIARLDQALFDDADADYRLTHALDSLRRTADGAGAIAELGIKTLRRDGISEATPIAVGGDSPQGSPTDAGQ